MRFVVYFWDTLYVDCWLFTDVIYIYYLQFMPAFLLFSPLPFLWATHFLGFASPHLGNRFVRNIGPSLCFEAACIFYKYMATWPFWGTGGLPPSQQLPPPPPPRPKPFFSSMLLFLGLWRSIELSLLFFPRKTCCYALLVHCICLPLDGSFGAFSFITISGSSGIKIGGGRIEPCWILYYLWTSQGVCVATRATAIVPL